MKASDRIRIIMIDRKVKKERGEYDEYDTLFGHESTITKSIIQYLDEQHETKISKTNNDR